jgi:hypothetical protein
MPFMTLRDYARHRGIALSSVQVAIKAGRIHVAKEEQHGKKVWKFVDSDIADKEWSQNTCVDQQRNPTRREMGISQQSMRSPAAYFDADAEQTLLEGLLPPPPSPPPQTDDTKTEESNDYLKERAKREKIARMNAELDYHEKVGTLAHMAKLRAVLFNVGIVVQQNMFSIAPRISSGLAAYMNSIIEKKTEDPSVMIDEIHIQDVLNKEIKIALKGMNDAVASM